MDEDATDDRTPAERTANQVARIFEALGAAPGRRAVDSGAVVTCRRCEVWIEIDGSIGAVLRDP